MELAKEVFSKVVTAAIKNVIFYGIGALVIAFIGSIASLRLVGIIMFIVYALLMIFSLITFLFSFIMGIVALPLSISERLKGNKEVVKKESYLWAGTVVQLVENVICLLYVLYLYEKFF